ncbi:MAG: putative alpha/beta superfamily hydrolase [Flavobacterium sp.]|jgi:predicted alpha/beta superfamily hydrolase
MKTFISSLFILFFFLSCGKPFAIAPPIPTHETFTIQSKIVNEARVINVWLPENYSSSTENFPVMYMPDGGIKEDFPHVANSISELIKQKSIPPMILVGIENTQRRRDLTGPTEVESDREIATVVNGSENFRDFIKTELFSEINKRYKMEDKKGIIGESLSGLFVVETFFEHPEMFDYYIAFDPSIWWNDHYQVKMAKEHLSNFPKTEKVFWFAGSGAEDISINTKALSAILKTENLSNLKWMYLDHPKENHSTIFRASKLEALKWTLGTN